MAHHGLRHRYAVVRLLLAALMLLAGVTAVVRLGAQTQTPPPAPAPSPASDVEVDTAPVELDGVALFRVRGVSAFPAAERARRIREQLVAVAKDRSISVASFKAVDGPNATRVQAGDRLIFNVLDADGQMEDVKRQELAAAELHRIQEAIAAYRANRTAAALRHGATSALMATLMLAGALLLLFGVRRWASRLVEERVHRRISSVQIKSFELLRAEQIWQAVRGFLIALRAVVLLGLVLVWLGYVLAQFPQTRGMARDIASFAVDPVERIFWGVVYQLPNVVFLAVLFVIVRLALRGIRLFFGAVELGNVKLARFDPTWAQPTYKIVRIAVIAFGIVIAYPYIPGSSSAAFQGISLFVGLLFSLGSSSVIANIVAGYAMIYRRAFKVGDRIKIGNTVGDVVETRLQVTHLRSVKNEEIIIPNSQILSSEVLNYSSLAENGGVILHTEVGIGYEVSWRLVEAMLIEAAHRTTDLGPDPRPYVLEKKLGDFAVVYELNVYCTNVKSMGRLYAALHRHILDVFNEFGVQIMTPAYEGDPHEPKVVPPSKDHVPPSTRFDTH